MATIAATIAAFIGNSLTKKSFRTTMIQRDERQENRIQQLEEGAKERKNEVQGLLRRHEETHYKIAESLGELTTQHKLMNQRMDQIDNTVQNIQRQFVNIARQSISSNEKLNISTGALTQVLEKLLIRNESKA